MTPAQIIEEYEKLVRRALEIVAGAPYHRCVVYPETAKLTCDSVLARLTAWRSYYDSGSMEEETAEFPVSLLTLEIRELRKWQADEEENAALERQRAHAEHLEMKRKEELALLAALKQKYGDQ